MKTALTIFAYFIVLNCTLASKQKAPVSGARGSLGGGSRQVTSGIIDIDAAQNDIELALAGSGGGPDDEGDDDLLDPETSGDGINEASGDPILLTICQQQRESILGSPTGGRPLVGAFVPRCTTDGQFERLQCHGSTGECWCVDPSHGQEVTGSRQRAPLNCNETRTRLPDQIVLTTSTTLRPLPTEPTKLPTTRPLASSKQQPTSRPSTTMTIQSSTRLSTSSYRTQTTSIDQGNKIDQLPNEPDIKFGDFDDNYVERPGAVLEPKSRRMSLRASVIGQPGILAAIIGAAVVVLLCLVLLVMFIVYRMHRKSQDPAIYYIDKPTRSPLTAGTSSKKAGYMKAMDNDVYG
jgi:hypothetical protein